MIAGVSPSVVFRFLCSFCCLVLLASCNGSAGKAVVWQDPSYQWSWPVPPDLPRIAFLRSISGPADFREQGKSGGVFRWLLGEAESDLPLLTPFSVVADDFGVVWVADNGARMLYRIDLSHERIDYIREVGGLQLSSPSGLAIDNARKRVYLTDSAFDRVFVFSLKGDLVAQWQAPGGMLRPAGMAVDASGNLYVADVLDGRVVVFGPEGQFLERRGSRIGENGTFSRPLNVAIGPAGELLVVDTMSFRVEVQSARGELLGTIGGPGDGPGYFARPRGIAVDLMGHVFVTDAAFDNVQVFDLTGQLLTYVGQAGSSVANFNLPAGLFVTGSGRLFVADSYNHRVQVFQLLNMER